MFTRSTLRARRAAVVSSVESVVSKVATGRAVSAAVEALEDRRLFAANVWKSAVSGSWEDASKWSLGHVPTISEDVKITVAGNYAVTLNTNATGAGYVYAKSLTVGGATGTQTVNLNKALYAYGSLYVGTGDVLNIEAGGRFSGNGAVGTTVTVNGTINLKGTTSRSASLDTYNHNYVGTGGQIVAVTGGQYVNNYFYGSGSTINSGVTIRGKNLSLYNVVNKSTIKAEGGSADAWYVSYLNNQGTFTATGGSAVAFDTLTNASGKTISVTGVVSGTGAKVGSLRFTGYTFSNLGTINVKNLARLEYDMTFKKLGTINRNGLTPLFGGSYDGGGTAFNFNATDGQWIWDGGELYNGSYNPTNSYAPKVDLTKGYGYGNFEKVTLTGNLSVPAGFYYNVTDSLTLGAGGKITLNGTTAAASAIYLYGDLNGSGEVLFATGGGARNVLSSSSRTVGSGIYIHGKSGRADGFTLNGVLAAESAGDTIEAYSIINKGNVIAAPGTLKMWRYTQEASGQLTVGLGGTSFGTNAGRFQFMEPTYDTKLAGTFNVVLMNGYSPASGTTFNFATFAKAPVGTFATKNLDAGNNKGFDFTQTATGLSVKAKALTGGLASRDAAGNLTVNGTTGIDTITGSRSLGLFSAVVNGRKSLFLDRQLISATINGGDNNDTIAVFGSRGATINGGNGNDKLTGGDGADTLVGGAGNDALIGGKGDDKYVFGNATVAETDTITELSGGGVDLLNFSTLTGKVTINLASDTATAVMTNRTVKTNSGGAAQIENAIGGAGDDVITGNALANTLVGGNGHDTINGGAGNDTLKGGAGNDKLTGGTGTDSMYGEAGVDTFYAADTGVKDLLNGGTETDVIGNRDAVDTLVSVP